MGVRMGAVGWLICAGLALTVGGCLGPGDGGTGVQGPFDVSTGGDAAPGDEGGGETKQPDEDAAPDAAEDAADDTADAATDDGTPDGAGPDAEADALADGSEGDAEADASPDATSDVAPDEGGPDAVCQPACDGRICGDDGCGGSCGACGTGETCDASGKCLPTPTCAEVTKIGCCDGAVLWTCTGGQVSSEDCGAASSCGWSADEGGYACGTGGQASPDGLAARDCPWKCEPQCEGKQCGDDGCGGSCGTCGSGAVCVDAGVCVAKPTCAQVTKVGCCDGGRLWTCEGGEVTATECGDGGPCGWDDSQGGYACGTDGGVSPDGTYLKACSWICYPQCDGKQCGDDGCGGSCGKCPLGHKCDDGLCCAPDCDGRACGDDGCGGSCGSCAVGEVCTPEGECLFACTPDCAGRECGDDGCGGSCGSCAAGVACTVIGMCDLTCSDCGFGPECLGFGFESGDLAGWQATAGAKVLPTHHGAAPVEGSYLLSLTTGGAEDGKASIDTCVPPETTAVRFHWRIYSAEFLEWCDSKFQDFFRVRVKVGSQTITVFERTIAQLCPKSADCPSCGQYAVPLVETELVFDHSGVYASDWQVGYAPLALSDTQPDLTLVFEVGDVGDSAYITYVLVDDVTFVVGCEPQCEHNACSDDGCGQVCGLCSFGEPCEDGFCGGPCEPVCGPDSCGDDGCGGSCGSCPEGQICNGGQCESSTMGKACSSSEDCMEPEVCVAPFSGGYRCAVACANNTCPDGYSCTFDWVAGWYCM